MSIQQLLLGAAGASGYNLQRSVRFRASATAYLNRTPASAGNRKTWTWSAWVKRGALSAEHSLFAAGTSSSDKVDFRFNSDNTLQFQSGNDGSIGKYTSSAVFRDPSSWYHVVLNINATAQVVAIYINGVQQTLTTNTILSNTDHQVNSTNSHFIGGGTINAEFDGYLAEINFIDGQALTPASFGSTNALTGVWQPAPYTGTYGTNGFYLKFTDNSTAAALGTDFSGNSNTWTVNNISLTAGVTYDSMTDVPTLTSATAANYAVLNPISNNIAYSITNGNLSISNGGTAKGTKPASFFLTSGKWYWEVVGNGYAGAVCGVNGTAFTGSISSAGSNAIGYWEGGIVYWDGGNSGTGASYTTSDIIGIALDMSAGTVAFYKNNTLQYTATFGSGTVPNLSSGCFPCYSDGASNVSKSADFNFGQRPFTYTPPTGFVALNTFNLAASTIVKGNTVMDATLYTGTASTQSITNAAAFQPDLIWFKSRSSGAFHALFDSVRGRASGLTSNATDAEALSINAGDNLVSFNSNGFTVGSVATTPFWNSTNGSGLNIVAWQWKAGGAAVTNTAGSISAQVSANPTAGFSVATWTGTGSAATIGHGLGVAPKMVIAKSRSNAGGDSGIWVVYHASLTSASYFLYLNQTNAETLATTVWNATAPTSSVFSVGTASGSGTASTHVAYCFADIDGFSKFGGYTGNGSTDGAFIYTGFRPRFVMVKQTNNVGNWLIWDTARSTYNQMQDYLVPNSSSQELNNVLVSIDALSNGFKCRTADNDINGSGDTYIYMAFAENPLKNALAR